jgi:hypothetical protein
MDRNQAASAQRLCNRIAELLDSVTHESVSRCADLAADVLDSMEFTELVGAQRLPPAHIENLLWAEEVLHMAEEHLDGGQPLNSELADNIGCRLSQVEDWLSRLAGGQPGCRNVWLAEAFRAIRSNGMKYQQN